MKGLAVRSPLIKQFICLVEKTSLLLLFLQLLPYLVSFYFSFSFLFYFQSLWVSMFKQWYSNPISVLVLVFVVYNRRREAQIKYPNPDDDVRENIINYEDEGGGEDDMTAFDITPLQIPVADPNMMVGHHPHHFHSLPRPTKVPVSCKWNLQFWNFAPFCFDPHTVGPCAVQNFDGIFCFFRYVHGQRDPESRKDVSQRRRLHRRPQSPGRQWPISTSIWWPQKLRIRGWRLNSWLFVIVGIRYTYFTNFTSQKTHFSQPLHLTLYHHHRRSWILF